MAGAYATVRLAHVNRADAHRYTKRRCLVHNELADLLNQLFLYLEPATKVVYNPVVFGQTNNLAGPGWKYTDKSLTIDRHQVVCTGRTNVDRPHDDELVELSHVLEFGENRRPREAAAHDLIYKHTRNAIWCVPRIM